MTDTNPERLTAEDLARSVLYDLQWLNAAIDPESNKCGLAITIQKTAPGTPIMSNNLEGKFGFPAGRVPEEFLDLTIEFGEDYAERKSQGDEPLTPGAYLVDLYRQDRYGRPEQFVEFAEEVIEAQNRRKAEEGAN